MHLSAATIRDCINNGLLIIKETISNFKERMGFIEGSSFDLTIDKVFALDQSQPPFIGVDIRVSADLEEIKPIDISNHRDLNPKITEEQRQKIGLGWYLSPGYYVFTTPEKVDIPREVLGILKPRRTYLISGCPVFCTDIAPGYNGILAIGMYVFNKVGIHIERGANAVACRFATFDSLFTDSYNGVWGGDKVSTDGVVRGK